jgi:hypothetical protein
MDKRRENPHENNGFWKRAVICEKFGIEYEKYEELLKKFYVEQQLCSQEISDLIKNESGINLSPRSIQRVINKLGVSRSIGDAFRLSCSKDRVKWAYKEDKIKRKTMNRGLRYKILQRDGFKCVLCGETGINTCLEIDHIIPVCQGGTDEEKNLRTLCIDCNIGKRIIEYER